MHLSRRQFGLNAAWGAACGAAALAGPAAMRAAAQPAAAGLADSTSGVRLGTCLYNFRSLPRGDDQQAYLGSMIDACLAVGVRTVEINATYLEPPTRVPFAGIPRLWDAPLTGAQAEAFARLSPEEVTAMRQAQRQWRLEVSASYFRQAGDRFRAAGLAPFSYVMTFTPDMTEEEIGAIFTHAQALGVTVFSTNQTKVEMAPRLAPFADRFGMVIGWHNHAATQNPNEVASRSSIERLFSVSPRMMLNLDVGHYVASNQDVMELARDHFCRITHFHMKDRKRDLGPGTPFGEGDVPLADLLALIRERSADAASGPPAVVEYEYPGSGTPVEEVRRSIAFMQDLLSRMAA